MADLSPILDSNGRPVRYAERDIITPAGINAEVDWLQRVEQAALAEHTDHGFHPGRVFLDVKYAWGNYTVGAGSYSGGVRGSGVASVTSVSTGVIEVTLNDGEISLKAGLLDCTPARFIWYYDWILASAVPPYVRVQIDSILSPTKFRLRRWQGDTVAKMTLADGDCTVVLYAE